MTINLSIMLENLPKTLPAYGAVSIKLIEKILIYLAST